MKNLAIMLLSMVILFGCKTAKESTSSNKGEGDTRTQKVEMLDKYTYYIPTYAKERAYGYTKDNPVKVGGIKENEGPMNERRFLNGLLGPNGEELSYHRVGSCCSFATPNGIIGNMGMLDLYSVYWDGCSDTLGIYINMYDHGDLMVPVGLKGKEKR